MIRAVRSAIDAGTGHVVVELCPNDDGGVCRCPPDGPAHPRHHFADARPARGPRRLSDQDWIAACARDAVALAEATAAQAQATTSEGVTP